MPHQHIFDASGRQICCSEERKVYEEAGAEDLLIGTEECQQEACCGCGHDSIVGAQDHAPKEAKMLWKLWAAPLVSFALLLIGLGLDFIVRPQWYNGWTRLLWYIIAYLPVGLPVLKEAWGSAIRGQLFSEFLLMGIATIGAFSIGEYPEGVSVMLFYTIGELFQAMAVSKAKKSIADLLDQRPDEARVLKSGKTSIVKANAVNIGDILQLYPGEKLALDAVLVSEKATFDTAALTGESMPDTKRQGAEVLAGMVNLHTVCILKVSRAYKDSKLSHILELVQNASRQKAPTELFIRKFAKVYTPLVVLLAVGITFLPWFWVSSYIFQEWLYRALVFLVISCPCALVISIPLGYFGGIGAGSRNGILIKGSDYLDILAKIKNLAIDKTGTLTEGSFRVQDICLLDHLPKRSLLALIGRLESQSTHPIAKAIQSYVGPLHDSIRLSHTQEIAGLGLLAMADGKELLVGNFKLMDRYNIVYPIEAATAPLTTIAIAYGGQYQGYITIADTVKTAAIAAVNELRNMGISISMLSGDKSEVVAQVAGQLGIEQHDAALLPADKVAKIRQLQHQGLVGFVGDGVNDAPAVALSDVGMAMGGLGSDATVLTADVVIQDDNPLKIPMAISIGRKTRQIIWQNIALAFGVKAIVLALGATGLATMWEAVFADVGVALLAILNAVRIQKMKY